jgi:hypothetical protein
MEALLQLKVVEILSGRFGSASQAGGEFLVEINSGKHKH